MTWGIHIHRCGADILGASKEREKKLSQTPFKIKSLWGASVLPGVESDFRSTKCFGVIQNLILVRTSIIFVAWVR